MSYSQIFRLKSYDVEQEFVVFAKNVEGYHYYEKEEKLCLYTCFGGKTLFKSEYGCLWDNWDEFITQLRDYFSVENESDVEF